jgi:hypothetical protein
VWAPSAHRVCMLTLGSGPALVHQSRAPVELPTPLLPDLSLLLLLVYIDFHHAVTGRLLALPG